MFERLAWVRRLGQARVWPLFMAILAILAGLPGVAQGQGDRPPGNPLYIQMIPFALIIVIFYVLILRPQQKRQKTLQKMIEGLRKGDRVLTGGGIYGTVFAIKGDTVVLEIGKDVRVEFAKSAITAVVPSE